jgi:hypothetical protein
LQLAEEIGGLLGLAMTGLFVTFVVFGQRIQYRMTMAGMKRSVERLNMMSERAQKQTVEYLTSRGKATGDVAQRVGQLVDFAAIMPVDLDPSGIVPKIAHVANTGDERIRAEITELMKEGDTVSVSIGQNLVELASALSMIHKVVRHFYISGSKTKSFAMLSQLQMAMPQVMEQAHTLEKAVDSVRLGQPVGDGIGPLVASKFIGKSTQEPIAKDTTLSTLEYKGRTLYVVKAEGPTGYVGQPGTAIQKVVEEMKVPLNSIIMVDAALKLEGEPTGEVSEGVGAAIGGIGVEKFQIEDVATKHGIPVYAVLVKESDSEAMTTMKQEIVDAIPKVMGMVSRIIEQRTKEGEKVLLAGIGNTLGIGQ